MRKTLIAVERVCFLLYNEEGLWGKALRDRLKSILILLGGLTLLLPFQNCGMQAGEEQGLSGPSKSYGSSSQNADSSSQNSINLSGVSGYGGASMGSYGSTSSFSESGSTVNLGGGSGSGGGQASIGGDIAGGGYGSAGWNYGQTKYRTSSLYPEAPYGDTDLSRNLFYFPNINALGNDAKYMWMAFTNVRANLNPQTPSAVERSTLLVISLRKLAQTNSLITYGMTGTSLCHHFSATVTSSIEPVTYGWSVETRSNSFYYSITGYKTTLSGVNVYRKTPEEGTQLEDSACRGVSTHDLSAVNSFLNIMRNYPIFSGDSSTIYMKDWNGSASSNTSSYALKAF